MLIDRKNFISVIVPTFHHPWELDQAMYSYEYQKGIDHNAYEIVVVNDDPVDLDTRKIALKYYNKFHNVRYIEVKDGMSCGITNATRSGNIGAEYANGDILVIIVDSTRILTPLFLCKTLELFRQKGENITTTCLPFHIGKHYSERDFTPEQCRKIMEEIKWERDPYRLFRVAAHTRISQTGNITESTSQGISRKNFFRLRGWNESFKSWGPYNIDLWRRCIRPLPSGGIDDQEIGIAGKWGKIGLGLEVCNIEGEGTFHINHDIWVDRDHGSFKRDTAIVWQEYERVKDCIRANVLRQWGIGDTNEVYLNSIGA